MGHWTPMGVEPRAYNDDEGASINRLSWIQLNHYTTASCTILTTL